MVIFILKHFPFNGPPTANPNNIPDFRNVILYELSFLPVGILDFRYWEMESKCHASWTLPKSNHKIGGKNTQNPYPYHIYKTHFGKEKYLQINNFKIRQSICKIRVSAHPLNIETGRYKNIIRSERKCTNCSEGDIEDEKHFVVDCPLYENIRVKFFDKVIDLCPNFRYMGMFYLFVYVNCVLWPMLSVSLVCPFLFVLNVLFVCLR